ncbi:MAG: M6 family metalloprotease domain-containing protein [Cyclobacteriaceae bacterium]
MKRVPPSPQVLSDLYLDYKNSKFKGSFKKYLESIGFIDPSVDVNGMDDKVRSVMAAPGVPQLVNVPTKSITGQLRIKVLMIDFSDKLGTLSPKHFEDLLFSKGKYPSGSLVDYYDEVTIGKVKITGSVHGWLRMPQPYSYYTNNSSGMSNTSYPRNAQKMAEDAVAEAIRQNVPFENDLDKLGEGIITALFIIHAGRGGEELPAAMGKQEIWSHKWNLKIPNQIKPSLAASIYLTVPEDCKLGVCAHELGHLAFQWDDFYDPNYKDDGIAWSGSGNWDLMAGGSWNNGGATPAHPAGVHKAQHKWITVKQINSSQKIVLKPYSKKSGGVLKLTSQSFKNGQYLVLENRTRKGFDQFLPGSGLMVWRMDESQEMTAPNDPALLLIQADGLHNLEENWNEGDAGDPFPGTAKKTKLGDTGKISTSFPGQPKSGIEISDIQINSLTKEISMQIKLAGASASSRKKTKNRKR